MRQRTFNLGRLGRASAGTLAFFVVWVAVLGAAAVSAHGAERATLTWDTDDTDVDLHVWDADGNHTYFSQQTEIPDSELSTDIIYGFGPEHFEEFSGTEGRPYTYGVCYFGAHTDDGSVPTTVATVRLTDPNGQVRTLKRTLRAHKDAYYLGASPQGADYFPSDDWCDDGPYHPASDTGPEDTSGGGGGSFEGCPRVRRRVGVAELCADQFAGGGPLYTAAGNVRVNGSVYLGEGPVTVNVDADTITAATSSIAVMRGSQPYPIAGGNLVIDTHAVQDPVSGRDQLANMTISSARPDLQALRVAGLPLSVTDLTGGALKLFLDRRDGGGVIAQAKVGLPFAGGVLSAGALAVGVHGGSSAPVRALGGSAEFGEVALPGGWKFAGLKLAYQEAGNTWQASGGLTTPFFGLDLSGGLADGQLDAIGVSVARDMPIGATGFIMTKLGGNVAGLAVPPLRISAIASAKWGSVPGLDVAVLLLNDVTLAVDLSGSASLKGGITFLKNPGPVKGTMNVAFAIAPFRATGQLTAEAKVGPLDVNAGGGIVMRTNAFTAAGGAEGKLRGIKLGSGRGVLSNKGIGITGQLCILRRCADIGAGMDWKDFPAVRYIGADVHQFVTATRVGARAAASGRSIVVKPGRPFLFVDADGVDGKQPGFQVRAPNGRIYSTRAAKADSRVVRDRAIGFTGLTIARPRPGRWTVTPVGSAQRETRFVTQSVRKIKRVRITRVTPRAKKPISRRTGKALRITWTSSGLPATARVNVFVTATGKRLGQFVVGGKSARRGQALVPRRFLRSGKNRIRLVVVDKGIAIDDVIGSTVIRAK